MGEKHPTIIDAERKCAEAEASMPEAYRKYLIYLSQRQNVGSRDKPRWITFELPYISVDGRIAMFTDEHRHAGKTFHIETTFEPCGEHLLCRADIVSELYGASRGHAQVNMGGGGVDRTSPFENGETSAIGRALRFLGMGLFGHGSASAEEMQIARAKDEPAHVAQDAAQGAQDAQESTNAPSPTQATTFASKAQINALLGLAERHDLVKRLDEALLAKDLDIQHLPLGAYKQLLEKMHVAIQGVDLGDAPDYEAFERQAKAEARAAREARERMDANDDEEKEDEQVRVDREWHRQGRVGPPFPSDVAGDRAALKEMGLKDDDEEDQQFLMELTADNDASEAEKKSEQMF